jgi:hypothetical protein
VGYGDVYVCIFCCYGQFWKCVEAASNSNIEGKCLSRTDSICARHMIRICASEGNSSVIHIKIHISISICIYIIDVGMYTTHANPNRDCAHGFLSLYIYTYINVYIYMCVHICRPYNMNKCPNEHQMDNSRVYTDVYITYVHTNARTRARTHIYIYREREREMFDAHVSQYALFPHIGFYICLYTL